ncbi:hypothetical protein ACHAP5_005735 [Fusarium lateritium]
MPRTPGSSASGSNRRGRGGRARQGYTSTRGSSVRSSSRTSSTTQQTQSRRPSAASRHTTRPSSRLSSSVRTSPASRDQAPQNSDSREPSILDNSRTNDRSSSEPVLHEVVMAIDMKENSTIGCAYFSTTDGILYVSEDIASASMDIAEQFLIHVQPSSILVSSRAPASFRDHLEKLATPEGE